MKTKILKWDVVLQSLMIPFNLIFTLVPSFWFFLLLLQFFEGIYQLISSGINLSMGHKSIGYKQYRQLHFIGSIAYIAFLCLLIEAGSFMEGLIFKIAMLVFFVIIPQAISYAYFWLCKKELVYLQNREFFILK